LTLLHARARHEAQRKTERYREHDSQRERGDVIFELKVAY